MIRVLTLAALLNLTLAGCIQLPCIVNCPSTNGGPSELAILQQAVNALSSAPGQWQAAMTNTINQLGQVATNTAQQILQQVQSTYNNALGQTGSEAMCITDFIGNRLHDQMENIGHQFFPSNFPAVVLTPVICTTNPGNNIVAGTTTLVTYFGYDFLKFQGQSPFRVDLKYASGQLVKSGFGTVAIPHNYELTVDIQGASWPALNPPLGPQLVLSWGQQAVNQSQIAVLLPTPTPAPTATPLPTAYYSQVVAADKWGATGDMSANYQIPIEIPAGYHWNGDSAAVQRLTNAWTTPAGNHSRDGKWGWNIVGTPAIQSGQLLVTIHIGAQSCVFQCAGISMQAGANFEPD